MLRLFDGIRFVSSPLRLLRLTRVSRSARVVRLARASRLIAFFSRAVTAVRWVLGKHGLQYALAVGAVVYVSATAIVFFFEHDEGNIDNYGEALWWGLATMTALRNDSHFPVTAEGRAVAIVVAFLGLTMISLITANIAAFLLSTEKRTQAESFDLKQQLDRLEEKLDAIAASADLESGATPAASSTQSVLPEP